MKEALQRSPVAAEESVFQSLQLMMDRIGVPDDMKWRSAILFMRSIKGYSTYSDDQKRRIQSLVFDVLKDRRFTDNDFHALERKIHDIMAETWKFALQEELQEISRLIRETMAMMLRRKGDLEALGVSTLKSLRGEDSLDEAIRHIRLGFKEMVTLMEEDANKLIEQSLTDALTGLGNRRSLDMLLGDLDGGPAGQGEGLGMLMVDVDNFKRINDGFGHLVGDQALVWLASVLQRLRQRQAALGRRIVPFRYGGEEFVVAAPGFAPEESRQLAEEIRSMVEGRGFTLRQSGGDVMASDVRITVSVGVACRGSRNREATGWRLLQLADECLYAAKTQGRNQVVCALPTFCEQHPADVQET